MSKENESIREEINIKTEWANFVNKSHPTLLLETPIQNVDVHLISQVFSVSECEELISVAESHGFGVTNYQKDYRGNLRLKTKDASLADAVWSRLKGVVPKTVMEGGIEYEAVGLNETWRLAKYLPGDDFKEHVDAYYEDDSRGFGQGRKSMYTVNIYMNERCIGGYTSFAFTDKQSPGQLTYDVIPKTGLCLLFRQPPTEYYVHRGNVVEGGTKYLFRSDVMYRIMEKPKQLKGVNVCGVMMYL